jgi:hypothetical protein
MPEKHTDKKHKEKSGVLCSARGSFAFLPRRSFERIAVGEMKENSQRHYRAVTKDRVYCYNKKKGLLLSICEWHAFEVVEFYFNQLSITN